MTSSALFLFIADIHVLRFAIYSFYQHAAPAAVVPPPLPAWSYTVPIVDRGVEGVIVVPEFAQGALTIAAHYDSVSRDYAMEGHRVVHSIRQWIHGREWRVRTQFLASFIFILIFY